MDGGSGVFVGIGVGGRDGIRVMVGGTVTVGICVGVKVDVLVGEGVIV